jgi:hypothetical protein
VRATNKVSGRSLPSYVRWRTCGPGAPSMEPVPRQWNLRLRLERESADLRRATESQTRSTKRTRPKPRESSVWGAYRASIEMHHGRVRPCGTQHAANIDAPIGRGSNRPPGKYSSDLRKLRMFACLSRCRASDSIDGCRVHSRRSCIAPPQVGVRQLTLSNVDICRSNQSLVKVCSRSVSW